MLRAFIAMTWPTHLLFRAVRRGSVWIDGDYTANQERLIAQGWRMQHLFDASVLTGDL